jgi:hypothetical protein
MRGCDCRALREPNNFYVCVEKKDPPYAPLGGMGRVFGYCFVFSLVTENNQKYTKM